jgi:transcription elongation factor GreB
MSRAFVKEDAPDGVVYIPPRAPLPAGAVNFVKPRGLGLLQDEMLELEAERERLKKGDKHSDDRNRALTVVRGKIKDLQSRILGAKLVRGEDQPQDEVRFGAKVTVKTVKGRKVGLSRTFTIVGVDETDLSTMRVGYVAPIARTLIGLKMGEEAALMMGGIEETLVVTAIEYELTPTDPS